MADINGVDWYEVPQSDISDGTWGDWVAASTTLGGGPDFIINAFSPLELPVSIVNRADRNLTWVIASSSAFASTDFQIYINGSLVYGLNANPGSPGVVAFSPTYSTSAITSGALPNSYNIALNRTVNWTPGVTYKILIYLPE